MALVDESNMMTYYQEINNLARLVIAKINHPNSVVHSISYIAYNLFNERDFMAHKFSFTCSYDQLASDDLVDVLQIYYSQVLLFRSRVELNYQSHYKSPIIQLIVLL